MPRQLLFCLYFRLPPILLKHYLNISWHSSDSKYQCSHFILNINTLYQDSEDMSPFVNQQLFSLISYHFIPYSLQPVYEANNGSSLNIIFKEKQNFAPSCLYPYYFIILECTFCPSLKPVMLWDPTKIKHRR